MLLEIDYLDSQERSRVRQLHFPDNWKEQNPERLKTLIAISIGKVHKIKSVKEITSLHPATTLRPGASPGLGTAG